MCIPVANAKPSTIKSQILWKPSYLLSPSNELKPLHRPTSLNLKFYDQTSKSSPSPSTYHSPVGSEVPELFQWRATSSDCILGTNSTWLRFGRGFDKLHLVPAKIPKIGYCFSCLQSGRTILSTRLSKLPRSLVPCGYHPQNSRPEALNRVNYNLNS